MTAWNPVAPGVRSPLGAENGARAAPRNSRQSSARPLGAGAGPALRRLRAHPGSLADMPDGYVAEAESAGGGYQRTACANLFDDLLIALPLRLIRLAGLALRLDAGLVADEPNQTWRQS